ncbi:hypothetical protein [Mucilaginibacter sp. NFR10]|uniref:hypothetical protein n=1 Tax=Mucilaginibacter sp. NFR10 TaxID=1566292 RepID=UPI000871860E|nr:hypothetical protein [Mucilaginibacter sp. NFR10]SCW72022.1 hypothetical protein SAMN03159284_03468 [Mucilaginibacter sp. NFR10]
MNKISYKTYLNDRLKQVGFHGQLIHPLYVQVTYERKTIFFKSYYFELFSKARYAMHLPDGKIKSPDLEQIIEKENEVIRFVIDKLQDGFSLEAFKKLYTHFSTDLCDATEFDFITYLYLFFDDKELPHMAELIKWGTLHLVTYDLMMEFKNTLKKSLYTELIEQAFQKAPPYLQLYGFVMHNKRSPLLCLTVMEWDNIETVRSFKEYVELHYPKLKSTILIGQVNAWSNYRRKAI